MRKYVDTWIPGNSGLLATRDYGGEGTPILLLHGASRSLADWLPIANELGRRYRLFAMDLRGHGRSDAGPWSVEALLDDISRVLGYYRVTRPVLLGHSLGGILAHIYSARYSETMAAINLDGFCLTPNRYSNFASGSLKEAQDREWNQFFDDLPEFSENHVATEMEELVSGIGLEVGIANEIVSRCLSHDKFGIFQLTISGETSQELKNIIVYPQFDMFELIKAAACRSLILRANDPNISTMPKWHGNLIVSRSDGIQRGLAELEKRDLVTVKRVDAGHGLLLEKPALVAGLIKDFLSSVAPTI